MQNVTWLVGCDAFPQYFMWKDKILGCHPLNGCELCTAVKTASLFVAIKFLQQRRFFSFLKVLYKHTHTHQTHTPLLLPPGLPKQGVVYNLSSPCTPLRGRGPAPAFPGVEEDPDDALLMTCQKERALHAAAYFTATQRLVITIHLRTCQDPASMLAVKGFPC